MTTETAVALTEPTLTPFQVIERVITSGDLAKMTPAERVAFYWRTCESLGLNALTRPFEFLNLNGKLTMYARKDATDQLRKLNAVSVTELRRERDDELGLLTVYARGRDKSGREDEATGVVSTKGLAGEALANAAMKAETKAKRRLTLSLVGLGFLDESEVEGGALDVDPETGEILERPKPPTLLEAVQRQRAALAGDGAETAQDDVDPAERTDAPDVGAGGQNAAAVGSGPVDEGPAGAEVGLTQEQFAAICAELGVTPAVAMAKARTMLAGLEAGPRPAHAVATSRPG